MSFFALFSVLVCVFHWRVNYPEKSFADAMRKSLQNLQHLDLKTSRSYLADQFEYAFTDRRAREEEEALARVRAAEEQRRLKALREKKAREEAARKAREEAEHKAAEAMEREQIQKAKEEAERMALEESRRRQAVFAKHTGSTKRHTTESRPMACNIPFAYVFPKCGRLAKTQPLFKPEELGFLQ